MQKKIRRLGKYVFLCTCGISAVLLLMSCGGSTEPTPVTNKIASFGNVPRWSPDSQKLAFGADGENMGIWVYYRTSGNVTQITDATYPHLYDYCWSPASDQIAFGGAGETIEETSGIFTVALDGSDPVRRRETGHSPCWSPDGTKIVFVEQDNQAGNYGIYEYILSSSLTNPLLPGDGIDPKYNPSGTKIAFRVPNTSYDYQLKVMSSAGVVEATLAENCLHLEWSSDGAYLYYDYMSFEPNDTGMRICKVPSGGGTSVIILTSAGWPSASSAGTIAYAGSNIDLAQGIFTADANGGNNQHLSSYGFQPCIAPDGSSVAFANSDGIYLVDL